MKPIEVTGKKIGDALKEGLRILGTTLDKVEYTVISTGGLFKKAKISIAIIEDESQKTSKPVPKQAVNEDISKQQKTFDNSSSQPKSNKPNSVQKETPKKDFQSKPSNNTFNDGGLVGNQKDFKQNKKLPPEQKPQKQQHQNNDRQKQSDAPPQPKAFEAKKRPRTAEIGEDDVKRAKDFVSELVVRMGFEAQINTEIIDGELIIDLVNESGALIGYRGETLDALEYLVNIHTNSDNKEYINIVVDSCGYRKKREKMLISMAQNAANKCIKTGRKVIMEPMNRNSRRIIHSALAEYDSIFTKSEGNEPNRHIILYFKREKNN